MIINLLFAFVTTLDSVTSKFNILNSRGLEYYKQMHNELKKTNKNIVDRTNTNTSGSTRDSCLIHNNHTIKKIVSKKKTRNGLGACLGL